MKKIIKTVLLSALIFSTCSSYSQGYIAKGDGSILFNNGSEYFKWSRQYVEKGNMQEYTTNYAFKFEGTPLFLKLTHYKKKGIIRYAFLREDNTILHEEEQALSDFIILSDNTLKGKNITIQYASDKNESIRLITVIWVGLWFFEASKH